MRVVGLMRGASVRGVPCDQPLRRVCDDHGAEHFSRCRTPNASKCVPCAATNLRLVTRKAEAGFSGRENLYCYMLTLTAPGDRLHYLPSGDACACTPVGGVDLWKWNPTAGKRWNALRTRLSQRYGDIDFHRGVEVQDGKRRTDGVGRGALHFHVLLASPVPLSVPEIRRLAIECGFGHSITLEPISNARASSIAARYTTKSAAHRVAEYAGKSAADRQQCPWTSVQLVQVVDDETGEILEVPRRMKSPATYRAWSGSRSWGPSMKEMRAVLRDAAIASASQLRAVAPAVAEGHQLETAGAASSGPAPPL
jgi:hypothetical protein